MIITKQIKENYVQTYSNDGYKIIQKETGHIYNAAVDRIPCRYTYEEIDEEVDFPIVLNNYEQIIDILTGQEGEE